MTAKLDAIEAGPKGGRLDLFGFARATSSGGKAGGGLDVAGRLTDRLSVFGRAEAGRAWDEHGSDWYAEALAGMRVRW